MQAGCSISEDSFVRYAICEALEETGSVFFGHTTAIIDAILSSGESSGKSHPFSGRFHLDRETGRLMTRQEVSESEETPHDIFTRRTRQERCAWKELTRYFVCFWSRPTAFSSALPRMLNFRFFFSGLSWRYFTFTDRFTSFSLRVDLSRSEF